MEYFKNLAQGRIYSISISSIEADRNVNDKFTSPKKVVRFK